MKTRIGWFTNFLEPPTPAVTLSSVLEAVSSPSVPNEDTEANSKAQPDQIITKEESLPNGQPGFTKVEFGRIMDCLTLFLGFIQVFITVLQRIVTLNILWNQNLRTLGVIGCGAAEATGLGFVCVVVLNPRVLSASRVDLGFFSFINVPILPPPPALTILPLKMELQPGQEREIEVVARPHLEGLVGGLLG